MHGELCWHQHGLSCAGRTAQIADDPARHERRVPLTEAALDEIAHVAQRAEALGPQRTGRAHVVHAVLEQRRPLLLGACAQLSCHAPMTRHAQMQDVSDAEDAARIRRLNSLINDPSAGPEDVAMASG